ncbi:hypothetical protein JHK87_000973 [Glycine soja]|nr:hypothetical protein JHK87_000973 [Glycine soja]
MAELKKAKRLIMLNHLEGFKKAQCQVKVLVASFDSARLDVNCNTVDGEIIRDSQLCSESEGEKEKEAEVWIRPLVGLKMITIHIRPHVFLKNLRFELDLLSA